MVDFGKYLHQKDSDLNLRTESDLNVTFSREIATAEYAYFYIHQIKAWSAWSVDQEEISYTIDSPRYLNVERFADV